MSPHQCPAESETPTLSIKSTMVGRTCNIPKYIASLWTGLVALKKALNSKVRELEGRVEILFLQCFVNYSIRTNSKNSPETYILVQLKCKGCSGEVPNKCDVINASYHFFAFRKYGTQCFCEGGRRIREQWS